MQIGTGLGITLPRSGVVVLPGPTLTLAFNSGGAVSPLVTAGGGANGYVFNSSGVLTAQAAPRITYNQVGAPTSFAIGANIHEGTGAAATDTQMANLFSARGFKRARVDIFGQGHDLTNVRRIMTDLTNLGVKIQGVLQTSLQYVVSAPPNTVATYNSNYSECQALINQVKDLCQDFEILNEPRLLGIITSAVPAGTAGSTVNGTWVPTATAFTNDVSGACAGLAQGLKGMAQAIHDQAVTDGKTYRVILGGNNRDWGWFTYMANAGVVFDVLGFHIYPYQGDASMAWDPYYGQGGPLGQLAVFNKPFTINEFNSGEIYDTGASPHYGNALNDADTEAGFLGIGIHMQEWYNYVPPAAFPNATFDSVVCYELLDEGAKSPPENHFGLMFDINTPKPSLSVVTGYAGGSMSAAEVTSITQTRAIMTQAQLTNLATAPTEVCQGLLIESARTNSVRNSSCGGAVVGTPGTAPTNWPTTTAMANSSGLTGQVVGTGTTNGINWIDLRFSGTTTNTNGIVVQWESVGGIASANGITWSNSVWACISAGALTNLSAPSFNLDQFNSGTSYLATLTGPTVNLTETLAKYTFANATTNQATVASVVPYFIFGFGSGVAVDITIRIGNPVTEQASFVDTPFKTTAGALTRSADTAALTGTNFTSWFTAGVGTLVAEFNHWSNAAAPVVCSINDGTASNYIAITASTTGGIVAKIVSGGVTQATLTGANYVNSTTTSTKVAISWSAGSLVMSINQGTITTASPAAIPTVTQMQLGNAPVGNTLDGVIGRVRYWGYQVNNLHIVLL